MSGHVTQSETLEVQFLRNTKFHDEMSNFWLCNSLCDNLMLFDINFYETHPIILESVLKLTKDSLYNTFSLSCHRTLYCMTTRVRYYIYIIKRIYGMYLDNPCLTLCCFCPAWWTSSWQCDLENSPHHLGNYVKKLRKQASCLPL